MQDGEWGVELYYEMARIGDVPFGSFYGVDPYLISRIGPEVNPPDDIISQSIPYDINVELSQLGKD